MKRRLNKAKHILKEQDMFGHEIQLNFNKQDEHKTIIGGSFSMILLVFMAIYFGLCIKKAVTGEDNLRLSGL